MKVFLVCSGLGQVNRGFESFALECFDALAREPSLDIRLFKGGGASAANEVCLYNTPRNGAFAKKLGFLFKAAPYVIEQMTFALSLMPYLIGLKPDLVYFSDGEVGNALWHWKKRTGAGYRLLLSNGAPFLPPLTRWDGVQHLTPSSLRDSLAADESRERQFLLPYGFAIPKGRARPTQEQQAELRRQLHLPVDRNIVLCVGAINKWHKRMDYVVEEIARLPGPRPYLVLLGQPEEEAALVFDLATNLLGEENFTHRVVRHAEVENFYGAANRFVLGSLTEGFGRVVVEAMSHGLPCCVHDSENMRHVLGEFGYFGDLTVPGGLVQCLQRTMEEEARGSAQAAAAYERFSWSKLRAEYVKMFQRCFQPNKKGGDSFD